MGRPIASMSRDKIASNPGLTRNSGRIGLQHDERTSVEFRDVKVRRIGATSTPSVIGSWVETRPGTPLGDRVRTFRADGTFVLRTRAKINY